MKKDQTMVKERLLLLFIFIVKKLYRSKFPLYFDGIVAGAKEPDVKVVQLHTHFLAPSLGKTISPKIWKSITSMHTHILNVSANPV